MLLLQKLDLFLGRAQVVVVQLRFHPGVLLLGGYFGKVICQHLSVKVVAQMGVSPVFFRLLFYYDVIHILVKLVLVFVVAHSRRHRHVVHGLLLVRRVLDVRAQGPLGY